MRVSEQTRVHQRDPKRGSYQVLAKIGSKSIYAQRGNRELIPRSVGIPAPEDDLVESASSLPGVDPRKPCRQHITALGKQSMLGGAHAAKKSIYLRASDRV
jgi:hypothetical protein